LSKVRVKWNAAGIQSLLRGGPTAAVVSRATDAVHANAGAEFTKNIRTGTRVRGYVVAETPKARRENAKNHTIQTAVGRTRI
jgi:hypothetical protein